MCVLQIAMSEHLKTLEVYHISTIPKLRLPLDVLFAASLNRDDAENLFQHLRTQLRKPSSFSAPTTVRLKGFPVVKCWMCHFMPSSACKEENVKQWTGVCSSEPMGTCWREAFCFWPSIGMQTAM